MRPANENTSSFMTHPGRWWHALEDDARVQCDLCPRYCKLGAGQRGFCFVRMNEGGAMALTTYGRSSGFCIDPIEKKPLNHFYPGSSVLSFGTAGCNLGCRFCQNWDISKSREMDTLMDSADPESIARRAAELGCRSVAFTYNDPVIFAEYAIDIADACRARGVKAVAVSAGYIAPVARHEFYAHMDAANIDLKGFTEEFYKKICFAELGPVLETLEYLKHETQVWFEVTTLLIPGQNDSDAELHRAADWFAEHLGPDVPWHFTAFHPDFKMMDLPPTPAATLLRARAVAKEKGLHYVYVGNVMHREASSTWCPSCGELLIERVGYELGRFAIRDGKCSKCTKEIAGHFENQKENWGSRRVPVRLGARQLD